MIINNLQQENIRLKRNIDSYIRERYQLNKRVNELTAWNVALLIWAVIATLFSIFSLVTICLS